MSGTLLADAVLAACNGTGSVVPRRIALVPERCPWTALLPSSTPLRSKMGGRPPGLPRPATGLGRDRPSAKLRPKTSLYLDRDLAYDDDDDNTRIDQETHQQHLQATIGRQTHLATMRFQKEFARQCVSARTRSTEEHKVKMESIVHFYRNNEILFDRIREQAIQQRKTAEELERQKANVTSDRDDLIKKLQMSNVDVKKQRLRRAMHGRRVQENNDEEQCRLQRLADLYFEQLANERQLSVRAHQLKKQHTALKKRTHDIANRLSKVGSPVQKKVPKPTAKPKSPKDERVPSVKFDAARDAFEAARSNTRHLSERIEAVRSDMHAADQERQALTARRIGQAASALREFTRNENVDLVRTFCQNFLHTGLTLCQGLERQLQCRSCRQRMVDPVMTLGCLHVQCRKCLSACRAASQCSNCNSLRPSNRFISSPGLDAALTALCALEKRLRSLQACTADLDDAVNPKRFGIPGTNK